MKTTLTLFLALALFSCKKEQPEPEPSENLCNCGIVTGRDGQPLNAAYYLYVESECSGELNHVQVGLDVYNSTGVGDRICVNDVDPW